VTSKGEGDNPQHHVLIDSGQDLGFDVDPGLFEDFADDSVFWGLVQLYDPTWRDPSAVVFTADG